MTFGSLFAGIGGFDLGLERAGLRCEWQVEIDGYARRVLAKHWPDVRRWDDVRTFPPPDGDWSVDLICGGFPCQDISLAGRGAGIDGARSGLWAEYARIIGCLRPCYVVVENVPALSFRGLDRMLGDIASLGFDAEWSDLSACSMGFPHARSRLFLLAYSSRVIREKGLGIIPALQTISTEHERKGLIDRMDAIRQADRGGDGVPDRVDRLRCLGNAVVPQVAEWIGRRILEAEGGRRA